MDKSFKKAIIDCTNSNITEYIDEVRIPKGFWRYRDPGKWVADNNNIKSVKTIVSKVEYFNKILSILHAIKLKMVKLKLA